MSSKLASELATHILLFLLIFGMSATVNSKNLRTQLRNEYAVLVGVAMQFIIMPFLGFLAVLFLKPHGLTMAMGVSLLIVTSSPGGSYSNWWCSLFNADLALSVAMTALSTIMSVVLLPANLLFYAWLAYGRDREESIIDSINFGKLFISIGTVIGAIFTGLYTSHTIKSKKFREWANRLGSVSGILLVLFSAIFGSTRGDEDGKNVTAWSQPPAFYVATIVPCLFGLAIANLIASMLAKLKKPEVVTLSVECCYQNVGIATSAAVSLFDDPTEISQALAVPLVYGLVEAVVLGLYCMVAWKLDWTKAPKDEALCTVLCISYETECDKAHNVDPESDAQIVTRAESNNGKSNIVVDQGIGVGNSVTNANEDQGSYQFETNSSQEDKMFNGEKHPDRVRSDTQSTGDMSSSEIFTVNCSDSPNTSLSVSENRSDHSLVNRNQLEQPHLPISPRLSSVPESPCIRNRLLPNWLTGRDSVRKGATIGDDAQTLSTHT